MACNSCIPVNMGTQRKPEATQLNLAATGWVNAHMDQLRASSFKHDFLSLARPQGVPPGHGLVEASIRGKEHLQLAGNR